MNIEKKFQTITLLTGVILAVIIAFFYAHGKITQEQKLLYENNERFLKFYFFKENEILGNIGITISQETELQKAFELKDRKLFYDTLYPVWKLLKQDGRINELRIFMPGGSLWLDMDEEPTERSPENCIIRDDIGSVHKSGQNRSYLYVCKTFVGMRYAMPFYGSSGSEAVISIGRKLDFVPKELWRFLKKDTVLLYDKKLIEARFGTASRSIYDKLPELNGYKIVNKGGVISMSDVEHINTKEKMQHIGFFGGYFVDLVPLDDMVGSNIGYMAFFDTDTDFLEILFKELFVLGVLYFSVLVFVVLIISKKLKAYRTSQSNAQQLLEQELIQQSKLASVGEVMNIIAHQWKQPLSVINLSTLMAKERLMSKEEVGKGAVSELNGYFDTMLQSVKFMDTTMRHFKDFLKDSKQKYTFDVAAAAYEVFILLRVLFSNNGIKTIFPEPIPIDYRVYGIENEFKQVVLNILSNAKDAFENKKIKNKEISIGFEKKDGKIVISVKDNAGGIDPAVLPKIFESRFSTKGEKGDGIGLYMSKIIIEKNMNGELRASNTEDGALFTVILPESKREIL